LYELDSEGYCSVDGKLVTAELQKQARLGARSCPEKAITLEMQGEPGDGPIEQ
jgi:ferredoxin